jgi:hypothetical protein
VIVAPVVVWVPLSAVAGAGVEAGQTVCHAENGSNRYEFDGHVDVAPATTDNYFNVDAYGGGFAETSGATVPTPASNNFTMVLKDPNSHDAIRTVSTPDNINYYTPTTYQTGGWYYPSGYAMYATFIAHFDKRNTPDPSCSGDTVAFTAYGHSVPNPSCPPSVPVCHGIGAPSDATP